MPISVVLRGRDSLKQSIENNKQNGTANWLVN